MKYLPIFLLVFNAFISLSQDFSYEAKISDVSADGFYKIPVSAGISAKTNQNISDIRIFDKSNREVAWVMRKEAPVKRTELFVKYKIIERDYDKYKNRTRLVIHNPNRDEIRSLSLIIRNSDVHKWLTLNASDDNKKWYVLKDRYFFHSFYCDTETSEIKILDFPLSNYEYYELIVYDFFNKPINIIDAGYYDTKTELGKYTLLSSPNFYQADSVNEKKSYIDINFDEAYRIDKIEFQLEAEGAKFFYRPACISIQDSSVYKKRVNYYRNCLHNFYLNSSNDNIFYFNAFKKKNFTLEINNKDDAPLKIKSIKAWQLNTYLVAYLEKGKTYTLKFGNRDLHFPEYDLKYFTDSISSDIKTANTSDITKIEKKKSEVKPLISFDSVYVWIILGVVIVLLVFLSSKMLKDMNHQKND